MEVWELPARESSLSREAYFLSTSMGGQIRAEAVQDLIERALHRRQCGEVLDYAVAAFDRLAGDDRIAVVVIGRTLVDMSPIKRIGRSRASPGWLRAASTIASMLPMA